MRLLILFALATCGVWAEQPAPVKVLSHRPGLAFVRFTDPRENAFTTEVPKGWKTAGGLFRMASVDTRGVVETVSPEGDIRVSAGDADVPPFTIPNQILAMGGFREGSWYSPGYGVRMMVRRYQPGVVFAEDYVRSKIGPKIGCSGVTITAKESRPDLTQSINALYAQFAAQSMNVREDAGAVWFSCTRNGQSWKGYYLATTQISEGSGGGVWNAEHILGYAAASDKAGLAEAAMIHLASAMQVNPDWVKMQQGVTIATSQIVAKTNEQISTTIRKTFENKWKTDDEIFRRDTNARRGVTDVLDPTTGESWTVQNASNHYWRKPGSDVIVGTQTYDSPGVGYEALLQH